MSAMKAAPDLYSAHTGPALANAHYVSEPDRVGNPGTGMTNMHALRAAGNHHVQ
ncbi:hypothetical protein [Mycobacterium sp. ITM-2016-00318]|uniref:hypothetical protein n=1 Tax=Mycobacterium sp. ITM-2016-00318 TaxID=2099693 RepID=UPI001304A9A1|nr:hypothetical protein [Mycobacterium sp. ITM-2016-00318]WNG91896.1 hypothetical protein C6A82_020955 [Mycobacterium sp. ITM-2016-00318]